MKRVVENDKVRTCEFNLSINYKIYFEHNKNNIFFYLFSTKYNKTIVKEVKLTTTQLINTFHSLQ